MSHCEATEIGELISLYGQLESYTQAEAKLQAAEKLADETISTTKSSEALVQELFALDDAVESYLPQDTVHFFPSHHFYVDLESHDERYPIKC